MNTNTHTAPQPPQLKTGFPPGPKWFEVPATLLSFKRSSVELLETMAQRYGALSALHVPGLTAYLVASPELIQETLVDKRDIFIKSQGTARAELFFGNPMQSNNGDVARRLRQMMSSLFRYDRVPVYADYIVAKTEQMLDTWTPGPRNISAELFALTLDIALHIHFGTANAQEGEKIKQPLLEAVALLDDFMRPPLWVPTRANRRLKRAMAALDAEVFARIAACRQTGGEGRTDLIAGLVAARDSEGQGMADKQIRDELVSMVSAGYFPTAVALIQTLRFLAVHTASDALLSAELTQVLTGGRSPKAEDLTHLNYTHNVLKESLRLCPPAGGIMRIAAQEGSIGGWRIPAGAKIFISQWVMHHSPQYFEAAEAFKPERWTAEFSSSLPNFVYFPFGWGARACVGQALSTLAIELILAMVLQRFRLTLDDSSATPNNIESIEAIQAKGGLKVIIQPR